ncbi:glycosyltransferase family 2 protein [Mucilaginibacter pedocola]|uniref:Glycosyltransferase 2-like domain-containing protein n=1 Tax=Mucilaginibacter pedocola TaxID=1792845 RepID=A0A1S9P7Y8_9SPHI|nr:glycosyltransferase family 2 protein [Mucilaginibacter pedocola]OOQ57066.1 hypothetical protein BC343_16170 [Mucilaginibacter pedocola]
MPQVSVIIPNYNHAPYLKQRINSVLQQTYRDFELIILDDCSPDNSRDVIEQYRGHERVSHIVYNETNGGTTFKQWKKGIELAAGQYIWIAESDDWCEPTLLETLMTGLLNNPACVIAYAQTYVVRGNSIEKVSTHHTLSEYVPGKEYILNYLVEECTIWNASMAVFKKENYFNTSQEFTTYKMSGDWLWYIEMAKQGDVFISGRVLNYFRNHDKDVSGKMYRSGSSYKEEIRILHHLKDDGLISMELFKTMLLTKYIRSCVSRYKFDPNLVKEVNEAFYHGQSYRRFLRYNAWLFLMRARIIRRMSEIIKAKDIYRLKN